MKRGLGRRKVDLFGVWSTWSSHIKYTWSIYWHSVFTETKGGDGAEEEEEKERRLGQRGREVDGRGGRDHAMFPFRIAFIVLLQTLTSNTTQPLNPQPPVRPVSRSLLFSSIVHGQVDSNWLFFHEADFSTDPPPRKRPFLLPLRSTHSCVCRKYAIRKVSSGWSPRVDIKGIWFKAQFKWAN